MTAGGKNWDASYAGYRPPGWDIGRPQPAFVRLASSGVLHGRVLDAGCGTGEHALLAAANGADAVGVDVAPSAIEQARRKTVELGVSAWFEVVNALDLEQLGMRFDVVIDSGLFHVLTDDARVQYVKSLTSTYPISPVRSRSSPAVGFAPPITIGCSTVNRSVNSFMSNLPWRYLTPEPGQVRPKKPVIMDLRSHHDNNLQDILRDRQRSIIACGFRPFLTEAHPLAPACSNAGRQDTGPVHHALQPTRRRKTAGRNLVDTGQLRQG